MLQVTAATATTATTTSTKPSPPPPPPAAAEAVGALVRLLTEVQLRPLLPRLLPGLVAAVKKERDWEVRRDAPPATRRPARPHRV